MNTAPTAHQLTIAGPNLPAKAKTTFEVHAAGCADLKRGYLRTAQKFNESHTSLRSLVEATYGDHMSENEPGTAYAEWDAYADEFRLMPCCADLPTDDQAPAAPAKAKRAPKSAPATKLTTEQKRRLGAALHDAAARIIDTLPEGCEDLDAGLAAEQLAAWVKYIPTTR